MRRLFKWRYTLVDEYSEQFVIRGFRKRKLTGTKSCCYGPEGEAVTWFAWWEVNGKEKHSILYYYKKGKNYAKNASNR